MGSISEHDFPFPFTSSSPIVHHLGHCSEQSVSIGFDIEIKDPLHKKRFVYALSKLFNLILTIMISVDFNKAIHAESKWNCLKLDGIKVNPVQVNSSSSK